MPLRTIGILGILTVGLVAARVVRKNSILVTHSA
jgi:hypothetical protein